MSYLLDTNVLRELRKSARQIDPSVSRWASAPFPEDLFASVVSIFELEIGVQRKERSDPEQGGRLRAWLEQDVIEAFHGRVLDIDLRTGRRGRAARSQPHNQTGMPSSRQWPRCTTSPSSRVTRPTSHRWAWTSSIRGLRARAFLLSPISVSEVDTSHRGEQRLVAVPSPRLRANVLAMITAIPHARLLRRAGGDQSLFKDVLQWPFISEGARGDDGVGGAGTGGADPAEWLGPRCGLRRRDSGVGVRARRVATGARGGRHAAIPAASRDGLPPLTSRCSNQTLTSASLRAMTHS